MNDFYSYPKEGRIIAAHTIDNSKLEGKINVAGRTTGELVNDETFDMIMYDVVRNDRDSIPTVLVSKQGIAWIDPKGEVERPIAGSNLYRLKIRLSNGDSVIGSVDISGYDRMSDYLAQYSGFFYEVFDCSAGGGKFPFLYVSVCNSIWVEPMDA